MNIYINEIMEPSLEQMGLVTEEKESKGGKAMGFAALAIVGIGALLFTGKGKGSKSQQVYEYYEKGDDSYIKGPRDYVRMPKATPDGRISMTERILINDTKFTGLKHLVNSANFGDEEAVEVLNSWGV